MKLTQKQIKRIIQEEILKLKKKEVNERVSTSSLYVNLTPQQEAALDGLEKAIKNCFRANVSSMDILDTVNTFLGR